MTELNESQLIGVIKTVLDTEINMYVEARTKYKDDDIDGKFIMVRGDTLITLREKLKQIKGIYND